VLLTPEEDVTIEAIEEVVFEFISHASYAMSTQNTAIVAILDLDAIDAELIVDGNVNRSWVPLNANNDNGSAWVAGQPGLPSKRDFVVDNLTKVDPELTYARISLDPETVSIQSMEIVISSISGGGGAIMLWNDQLKTDVFQLQQDSMNVFDWDFYIEGLHESYKEDDVVINLYIITNTLGYLFKLPVTVTPVLKSLKAEGQTGITFTNGFSLAGGINVGNTTLPAPLSNGVKLTAEQITGDSMSRMDGYAVLFQNLTNLENGEISDSPGGSVFNNGPVYNFLPSNNAQFPWNDFIQGTPIPGTNTTIYRYSTGAGGSSGLTNGVKYWDYDSPKINPVPQVANSDLIDVRYSFRTYAAIIFKDASLYSLGYTEWSAWVLAERFIINEPSGVYASSSFTRSNEMPNINNISANGSFTWQ
jgi:hypothetical protein